MFNYQISIVKNKFGYSFVQKMIFVPHDVTSGPMRGLKKLHPIAQTHRQTSRYGDSMTELAQWNTCVGGSGIFGFLASPQWVQKKFRKKKFITKTRVFSLIFNNTIAPIVLKLPGTLFHTALHYRQCKAFPYRKHLAFKRH